MLEYRASLAHGPVAGGDIGGAHAPASSTSAMAGELFRL